MTWTKYAGNPTFIPTGSTWEDDGVYVPRLLKNLDGTAYVDGSGQYWMYYSGANLQSSGSQDQGGLAFSTDLINWTRYGSNPIFAVSAGTYYAGDIVPITIVKDGGTWHCWFEANRDNPPSTDFVTIGYASSSDGIAWSLNASPILAQGPNDDSLDLYAPAVIKDGSTWKMWYTGHNAAGKYNMMYATAVNPQGPWTKYSNYYIFSNAADYVSPSEVWKEGSTYFMTYYADGQDIDVATSSDGINWTARGSAMARGATGAWDDYVVYWASQIKVSDTWYNYYAAMKYTGSPSQEVVRIGFATSAIRTPWSSDGVFTVADLAAGSLADGDLILARSTNIRKVDGSSGGTIKKIDGTPGGVVKRYLSGVWQ